jgi:pimeloyl-ACP methyl ester carboxylesterase
MFRALQNISIRTTIKQSNKNTVSYISERNPLTNNHQPLAEVFFLGGVLTTDAMYPLYRPLLSGNDLHSLGEHSHYLPHPKSVLSNAEELYKRAEDKIMPLVLEQPERSTLVGWSLGGAVAVKLALEHPDSFSDVITIAGAEAGIPDPTSHEASLSLRGLFKLVGNISGKDGILSTSANMREQRERIQAEWSKDIKLHMIKPTFDDLLRFPHGLDLQLPEGQSPRRMIVAPTISMPGFINRKRNTSGMYDLKAIKSALPASHYDIPLNPSVISYIRKIRRGSAHIDVPIVPIPKVAASVELSKAA